RWTARGLSHRLRVRHEHHTGPSDSEGRSRRRARTLIRRTDRKWGSKSQISTLIRLASRRVVNMAPGSTGTRARRSERSFPVVITAESARTIISSRRLSATQATAPKIRTVFLERGLPAEAKTATRFLLRRRVRRLALITGY